MEWIDRVWFCYNLGLKIKETINKNETKHNIFHSNSKTETIIHGSDMDNVFESIYSTIMTKI